MKLVTTLLLVTSILGSSPFLYSELLYEGELFNAPSLKQNQLPAPSLVEPEGQINDFEARFELNKLLARHPENQQKALEEYLFLLKEKPENKQLWLEIGKIYTAQNRFPEAAQIFNALVYHHPLAIDVALLKTDINDLQTAHQTTVSSLITENFIRDNQAWLELARLISRTDKGVEEAITIYQHLLFQSPHDPVLALEISRLYLRQKQYHLALFHLYPAIQENPKNADLLVEGSRAELGLGHPKQSYALLLKALSLGKHSVSLLIDEASILMFVGDFYRAGILYQQALNWTSHKISGQVGQDVALVCSEKAREHCQYELDLALALAWSFVSAQRYEEAEGMYRKLLLCHPNHPKILEALATLKVLEKDFDSALQFIDNLLDLCLQDTAYLQLKAQILFKMENYLEALKLFDFVTQDPKFYMQGLIGKGKVYLRLGQWTEAQTNFQRAYKEDPSSIPAQFYQAWEVVHEEEHIHQIISQTKKPEALIEWANLYAENGMGCLLEFYEATLNLDPDYFPAQVGLAEALSSLYRYEEALEVYLSILDAFPQNSKILLSIARVLSWSKCYQRSMEWYDQLIALDPHDPVPRKEKARVAYWGYFFDESMSIYHSLLELTVDHLLQKALQKVNQESCEENTVINLLIHTLDKEGAIYTGYEAVSSQFCYYSAFLNETQRKQIEFLLIHYLPLYRIQKSMQLERDAKYFGWYTYYLHALPLYQELADFNPGNEEGLYGYAQDLCSLGLCDRSRSLYNHILNISPGHNLVKMALERNLWRQHPLVQGNYTYWTERGSGQFSNSQIARQQLDQLYEWSPMCSQQLRLIQHEWLEYPFFKEKYYFAEGQTLEVNQVFNSHVRGFLSATRKNYFQEFDSRYTCLSNLWFNLYDYAHLGLGFERRNEIYNYFTLLQGIQAKIYWATLSANTHSWASEVTYSHYDYNDRNTLDHVNMLLSYRFTEDPQVFKLILNANYRNTEHLTEIIINPLGEVVTIIHPYWTPRDYYSGSLTFQFRYNYNWFTYCEAPQRYIDIKLTGEEDTAHNPSIQLKINWKHEFMYHYGFEITALYHRSRLWNADGIWAQLYYRF